jgi:hypothetical protein
MKLARKARLQAKDDFSDDQMVLPACFLSLNAYLFKDSIQIKHSEFKFHVGLCFPLGWCPVGRWFSPSMKKLLSFVPLTANPAAPHCDEGCRNHGRIAITRFHWTTTPKRLSNVVQENVQIEEGRNFVSRNSEYCRAANCEARSHTMLNFVQPSRQCWTSLGVSSLRARSAAG